MADQEKDEKLAKVIADQATDEKAERDAAAQSRSKNLKRLDEISKGQGADSDKLDWKDRIKARKQRDSMIKGDRSLKGDLKKNVKDMKDNFLGGIDSAINDTFGPIGPMMSSLTTGIFKRGDDAKEAL